MTSSDVRNSHGPRKGRIVLVLFGVACFAGLAVVALRATDATPTATLLVTVAAAAFAGALGAWAILRA